MYIQGTAECASGCVDDTAFVPTDDMHEAELLMRSLSVTRPGEPPAPIDRTSRAIVHEVITGMRFLQQKEFRHGHDSKNALKLSDRLKDPLNKLPFHGGANSLHTKSSRPRQEGDEIGVLFTLVLERLMLLNNSSSQPRMSTIPKGAADPQDFHRTCWKQFAKNIDDWSIMSYDEKYQHVYTWLFKKFTMDPYNQVMLPGSWEKRKPRNDACWTGFWMSDRELRDLVNEVLHDCNNVLT